MNNEKRIYLLGPTATGKTELVSYLNSIFPINIISVDSAQIYKNMNIGTATVSYTHLTLPTKRIV